MKTRFDVYGKWVSAYGEVLNVSDMQTDHILNCLRMMIQKPSRTMSMLIIDIENKTYESNVWTAFPGTETKESIANVTSMSLDQLKDYATKTPLFQSMCDELGRRGVNVSNILSMLATCEAF